MDVGGTFTDLFVLDEHTGEARVIKVPSTRGEEARGFMNGIGRAAEGAGAIATIVHGTTVGTNALLERKVARTGIITTAGFRDVLEMRRRDRPQTWGLRGGYEPVVPRDLRLEVDERVLADGAIHTEVNVDQVEAAARGCWRAAARRSACSSSTPTPIRPTRPARWRGCARSGPTATSPPRPRCCPRSASSSAARPLRSTPPCNRWWAAT